MEVRLLLLVPLLFILVTLHMLPFLPRSGRLFGIAVAPDIRYGQPGRRLLRSYEFRLLPWTVGAIACSMFLPLAFSVIWILCASLVPMIAAGSIFLRVRHEVQPFAAPTSSLRSVVLRDGEQRSSHQRWLYAVPLLSLVGVGIYLFDNWDAIPSRFPIHWDGNGAADGWTTRSVPGVFGPLLIGILVILFLAVNLQLTDSTSRKSAQHPAVRVARIAGAWVMGASFSLIALLPLHSFSKQTILWFDVGSVLFVLALLWLSAGRGAASASTGEITPDACWHGDQFYYNPQDPALFVEKRMGVGLTFNFGNRLSWLVVILILLIPAGLALLALRFTVS